MSDTKHTPGPWTVDNTNAFGVYGVWTDYVTHPGHDGAGYGSQICSMFTVSFEQTDKATRPQRDANARLIAAAPDLLEACEDAIVTGDRDMQHILDNGRLRSVLQAAIAKAKGGTP